MNNLFYGIYRGICTTNADPEKRMRIKLQVPQLLGEEETTWAWPCVSPGWPYVIRNHDDVLSVRDPFPPWASALPTTVHTPHTPGTHSQYTGSGAHEHSDHVHSKYADSPNKEHLAEFPTPRPGDGVWVMFEGGDLTKPVWMGVWQRLNQP